VKYDLKPHKTAIFYKKGFEVEITGFLISADSSEYFLSMLLFGDALTLM
jgi:hypothetical protein